MLIYNYKKMGDNYIKMLGDVLMMKMTTYIHGEVMLINN